MNQKKKREKGRGNRRREEQAKKRVSIYRRKDNVNVKNLSNIRNSIGLTHFTRILGETTAVKDGSTTAGNICHPAKL